MNQLVPRSQNLALRARLVVVEPVTELRGNRTIEQDLSYVPPRSHLFLYITTPRRCFPI